MSFFTNPEILLKVKLLEGLYILMGIVAGYTGIKTLFEKEHKSRYPTAVFWIALAVILTFGRWLPTVVTGVLVVIMALPAVFKKVLAGPAGGVPKAFSKAMADKIGYKIFLPTLSMGTFAILFAVFTKISPLVGVGVGVIVAMIMLMFFSKENTPKVFFDDSKRLLDMVGPLSMLPMLLAALGALFTKAGVGQVIAGLVSKIIPEGNVTVGIIVFAIAMPLFTMIMGNAFAAITVITVGIGGPFVLAYGANPTVIGMLALTCGYCGTLCTPMAANFNIVPVAILDMKGKYNVIKNQLLIAGLVLTFQICYMLIAK
ncbi:MAG: DUF979 domain-containing protein [Spirochaetae bacterium HGW-Spirochaetae-3]|jgi:uncharacterized membrane protein|nr:MAG: DUF979 domain-containing protein [Spirochaetae bacterium HGW-Spirochaetae-3]